LTEAQVATLPNMFSDEMKKLTAETIDLKDRPKPKFNK